MKIILAYSGGLDTSVALHWLGINYNAEVIAFCADVGQRADFPSIRQKAEACGASKVYIEDRREDYIINYVYKALQANAAYEGRYLLAAPLSRPLIAKRLVEIAHSEGATAVAHGSTGKGNDQVRFYGGVMAHDPSLQVIAPAIEWQLKSREDEIAYAIEHDIDIPVTRERPFSLDGSIWGGSTECGIIDDYSIPPPESAYQLTCSPENADDSPIDLSISFHQGIPVTLNGIYLTPIELISTLNQLGGKAGIGRVDIVENSLLGIKSRAVYESPAGCILHRAHQELESITLDRDTAHYKMVVSAKYAELVYYGQWFSSLRLALQSFVETTQCVVCGSVRLRIYKGNIIVLGRESELALYDSSLSSHDNDDRFDHISGQGFAYIWSLPQRIQVKCQGPSSGYTPS
jgi:argininosuccinate synthase